MNLRDIFYTIKPLIPRKLQLVFRRRLIQKRRSLYSNIWPINENASEPPNEWPGWPDQKQFALVLTHDVDTGRGQEKCWDLMRLEEQMGFRSSFNFVPKRYHVSSELRTRLTNNGFEVGVHGLYHDGKLYKSKNIFEKRAKQINQFIEDWNAVGFRSPAMHHNLDWIHGLNITYDASTFDTDPFEPQSDGMSTIFPFWVQGNNGERGYVELPYTLPQDFTLFVLLQERNVDIWKQKLDWIVKRGGMVLLNTHPDYMNFNGDKLGIEEYPADYYAKFLEYIKCNYEDHYWHVLPKDAALFVAEIPLRIRSSLKNPTKNE
ncbi:MAG: hypothetical protein O6943_03505 [Bacteroidetes bacterium]|nr:hypothetical protein [Bacteroidota bacterium]